MENNLEENQVRNALKRITNGISMAKGNIERNYRAQHCKKALPDLLACKDALDKQIPKKPIPNVYKEVDCPTCEVSMNPIVYRGNYCPCCGQRLDWGN